MSPHPGRWLFSGPSQPGSGSGQASLGEGAAVQAQVACSPPFLLSSGFLGKVKIRRMMETHCKYTASRVLGDSTRLGMNPFPVSLQEAS